MFEMYKNRPIHFTQTQPLEFVRVFERHKPDFGTLTPDKNNAQVKSTHFLAFGGVEVMSTHFLDGVRLAHEMELDGITFVIPTSGYMGLEFDTGRYVEAIYPTAFTVTRCRRIDIAASRNHTRVTFSRAALNRKLSSILDWPVGPELEFDMLLTNEAAIRAIKSALVVALRSDAELHPGWLDSIEGFLAGIFLSFWPHNYFSRLNSQKMTALPKQVKIAIDLMQSNPFEKIYLDDLCKATSASARGLQKSFKSFTGRSIREYQFELRMQWVNTILQKNKGNKLALKEKLENIPLHKINNQYRKAFGISIYDRIPI